MKAKSKIKNLPLPSGPQARRHQTSPPFSGKPRPPSSYLGVMKTLYLTLSLILGAVTALPLMAEDAGWANPQARRDFARLGEFQQRCPQSFLVVDALVFVAQQRIYLIADLSGLKVVTGRMVQVGECIISGDPIHWL